MRWLWPFTPPYSLALTGALAYSLALPRLVASSWIITPPEFGLLSTIIGSVTVGTGDAPWPGGTPAWRHPGQAAAKPASAKPAAARTQVGC